MPKVRVSLVPGGVIPRDLSMRVRMVRSAPAAAAQSATAAVAPPPPTFVRWDWSWINTERVTAADPPFGDSGSSTAEGDTVTVDDTPDGGSDPSARSVLTVTAIVDGMPAGASLLPIDVTFDNDPFFSSTRIDNVASGTVTMILTTGGADATHIAGAQVTLRAFLSPGNAEDVVGWPLTIVWTAGT